MIAIERGRSPEASDPTAIEVDLGARGVIARDQAPQTKPLRRGASARRALERAILADVRGRIARGRLTGRAESVRCRPARPTRNSRRAFRCTALAGGVRYPFLAVVDLRTRRITWCKRDPPPLKGGVFDVPVSRRCLR